MSSIIFAILAGISVTMQNSINGLMTPLIGAMGTSFTGFVIQLFLLLLYQFLKERKLISLKKVPPLYFSSGFIAAITVGTIGFCVSRMGSAVTTCCSVAGQMIMSALVDHFGLFGTQKHTFSGRRLPGFLLILSGVLSINLIGGSGIGEASLSFLFLAMCLGACAILIRTLNFRASQVTGSSIGGGIVNSLSGTVSGLFLFILTAGFKPDFSVYARIPASYYLAGVFGTSCLLFNIAAYQRQNIFYATIFMLIGQVGTGILMDILVFHSLSFGKCIGIAIILSGVLLDKLLTRQK